MVEIARSWVFLILISCVLISEIHAVKLRSTQYKALNGIKAAINPKNTILKWAGTDCSGYKGLTCDSKGYIIAVNFKDFGLVGTFSSWFNGLPTLTSIDLSGNNLYGTIPDLTPLKKLTFLDVSKNQLVSSYSAAGKFLNPSIGLSGVTSLTNLSLASNQFYANVGTFLTNIAKANPGLVKIDISNNHFYSFLTTGSIGKLAGLSFFDARNNDIFGIVPKDVLLSKKFTHFAVGGNKMSLGIIPTQIYSWPSIKELSLSNCNIQQKINNIYAIKLFSKLDYLDLSSNRFYSSFPTLSALPAYFDVSNNAFSGPLPSAKVGPRVSYLYRVSGNFFTGSGVVILGNKFLCPATVGTAQVNCLSKGTKSCPLETQRSPTECANFCQLTTSMCQGNGVCLLNGPSKVPTCECDKGYATNTTNYALCSPTSSTKLSPVPSLPTTRISRFTNQISPKAINTPAYLNNNQRFLSSGFAILPKVLKAKYYVKSAVNYFTDNTTLYSTPQDEGSCVASWAFAATYALAAIVAKNRGVPPDEWSVQQLLDCVNEGGLCKAGSPYDAFDYISTPYKLDANLNYQGGGVYTEENYPFVGANSLGRCRASDVQLAGGVRIGINYYEATRFESWIGLLLAVQKQPVVAFVQADAKGFQTYGGGYVYSDPNCYTTGVNLAVVVTGYTLYGLTPYWTIRNSWGAGWGANGTMQLGLKGGVGVCGINTVPALYPILNPNPSSTVSVCSPKAYLNAPCGGGTCVGALNVANYTCTRCPPKFFISKNSADGLTNCKLADRCTIGAFNPCGVGTCTNDGTGSYTCLCPKGYKQGLKIDGRSRTCVPSGIPAVCYSYYSIHAADTCASIANFAKLSLATLQKVNPTLNCNKLVTGSQVCLLRGAGTPSSSCAKYVEVLSSDTCDSIRSQGQYVLSRIELLRINPGLHCGLLQAFILSTKGSRLPSPGSQVCVKEAPFPKVCPFKFKPLTAGLSCKNIYDAHFNSASDAMTALNNGMKCNEDRLYVGQSICAVA